MNYKNFIAGAMAFALAACTAGCGDKKETDTKVFIDELRTRNGNLNIIMENPDDMLAPVL